MSDDWVREHACELGAIRTTDGPGGVYRFEPEAIDEWKARRRIAPAKRLRRPGPAPAPSGVELFPLPNWR